MNVNKRTRADGTVVWRARYPDPTRGGRRQIERRFRTKREAERWITSQRAASQRGEHIDPRDNGRTINDLAADWRDTWGSLKPKTTHGYESILHRHILPRWGGAKVGAIPPEAIQDWINGLAAERAPATVRRVYGVLRSVLNLAVKRRYITANPCESVELPRQGPKREQLFLTAEEVAALAEAIDPFYRALIYTAAYAGLRSGELGALRRRDVDLLHGTLTVRESLADVSGKLVFGSTKTGVTRRVGLPRFLAELLTEHLDGIDGGPDALVFPGPEGGPMRHHNFYLRHFKPTVKRRSCDGCADEVSAKAKRCPGCKSDKLAYLLPPPKHGLRFHDLRHTCASLSLAVAPNLMVVKERLGHTDIQTTVNIYGHLLPSVEDALAEGLEGLFQGASVPENVRELHRS